MRYTEEEIQALRKRWEKPLLKPGSFTRDENGEVKGGEPQPIDEKGWRLESKGTSEKKIVEIERIETFQDLLTTRLKQIEVVLLPEIEKIDKSLDWDIKRKKYQEIWDLKAQKIIDQLFHDLEILGLTIFLHDYIDLRGSKCNGAKFQGAFLQVARFDGADCSQAHFDGADLWTGFFTSAICRNASFEGASSSSHNADISLL